MSDLSTRNRRPEFRRHTVLLYMPLDLSEGRDPLAVLQAKIICIVMASLATYILLATALLVTTCISTAAICGPQCNLTVQPPPTATVVSSASVPVMPCDDFLPLFFDRRRIRGSDRSAARRKGPRGKIEIERDRQARWERTCREVDEIYAEYEAQFQRVPNQVVGTIYARYSTRFQDSIGDQIRAILEHALKLGIYVPRENIFFDLAVRGFKKQRGGLEEVERTLRTKRVKVLLLYSTSRLFRKRYRTLEFVDRIHKGLDVRCIFIKSGVDTADKDRWQSILAVQSMIDEFVVTMYVENIRSAHEGLLAKRLVFGTLSFGYKGEPIEGELTNLGRPRCRIILDPETAKVVRQIFHWYVEDELSINEIIRRLNGDPDLPLPPRATSGEWTRFAVKRVLTNSRYAGMWKYGVTESVYIPDGDYNRQRLRAEPLKEIQIEDLRIVPDDVFFAAQARIVAEGRQGGRRAKDGDRESRPKLLNGIVVCPKHEMQPLHVSGPFGTQMHCPSCRRLPQEKRPLYSILNRRLAVEMLCETLVKLIQADVDLVENVMAACTREVELAQRPDPSRLTQLRNQVEKLDRSIALTRRTSGDTEEDQAEAEAFIKQQQRERVGVIAEIKAMEAVAAKLPSLPTEAQSRQLVEELSSILQRAAASEKAEDVALARKIIRLLTGGRIELFQMGERLAQRGWLQGRFRLQLLSVMVKKLSGVPATQADDGVEVTIDFQRPSPLDAQADEAWALREQGLLNVEIGERIGFGKSMVTKLLKHAAAMRGVPFQDGRRRRGELGRKNRTPPLYVRIAPEVGQLVEQGLLLVEIGERLKVDLTTLTKAYKKYRADSGLPPLDGRARRKLLAYKNRPRLDD